jgi:translation initiation factor IF-2
MHSNSDSKIPRSPVVAVMGHIDHGKSTLLDYIRSTNVVDKETGGITQKISAYEMTHKFKDRSEKKITFLDTPGHEAFSKIRQRGAGVADVAVLVVSAEDGVKPQTLDALKAIKSSGVPFVVAINKIDRPNANIEKTKMSLAENEVFIEGYGGDITAVPISAKTGAGIEELLDMIILTHDVLGYTGDPNKQAEGIIIEAHTDKNKGTQATLVIKDGTLNVGDFIVCGKAWAKIRFIETFAGKKIDSATFSSPVQITGWSELPNVGEISFAVKNRDDALKITSEYQVSEVNDISECNMDSEYCIPLIIKTDAQGTSDAIVHEIKKINTSEISFKIIHAGIGDINESDMKSALTKTGSIVISFGVGVDKQAETIRERNNIEIKKSFLIYELADYLKDVLISRKPKKMVEEIQGSLKVLKFFSKTKDKQVIGCRVENGKVDKGSSVKIFRRENLIGLGKILEIQSQKVKVSSIEEGTECGMLFESKIETAPGDILQSTIMIEK